MAPIPNGVKDIIGMKFGRLLAIEHIGVIKLGTKKYRCWLCKCDCGKIIQARHHGMISGTLRSCGCLARDTRRTVNLRHGFYTNGVQHRAYSIWAGIKTRCTNPNRKTSKYYFEKGVTICKEWMDAKKFMEDMLPTYKPGLSIHRLDNSKGYCKENCVWATPTQQGRLKSNNHLVTIGDKTQCVTAWCEHFNITVSMFYHRVYRGATEIEALTTPRIRTPRKLSTV